MSSSDSEQSFKQPPFESVYTLICDAFDKKVENEVYGYPLVLTEFQKLFIHSVYQYTYCWYYIMKSKHMLNEEDKNVVYTNKDEFCRYTQSLIMKVGYGDDQINHLKLPKYLIELPDNTFNFKNEHPIFERIVKKLKN